MSILKFWIFILFCTCTCSSFGQNNEAKLSENRAVRVPETSLTNLYKISADLYRSEQPGKAEFAQLSQLGIVSVLNLRERNTDKEKAKTTKLVLYHVPMEAEDIKDADVVAALKILRDCEKPVLVHCKHGADRTGLIIAMCRIVFQNRTKEEALDELLHGGFGFHPVFKNIPQYLIKSDVDSLKKQLSF